MSTTVNTQNNASCVGSIPSNLCPTLKQFFSLGKGASNNFLGAGVNFFRYFDVISLVTCISFVVSWNKTYCNVI